MMVERNGEKDNGGRRMVRGRNDRGGGGDGGKEARWEGVSWTGGSGEWRDGKW
jgi:hypothetical protein